MRFPPTRPVVALTGAAFYLLGIPGPSLGWAARPTVRLTQGVRASLRSDYFIPSEATSRLELEWAKKFFRFFPFYEIRRDLDHGRWSRMELGAEVGMIPCRWFYLGQAIHQAWLDPGDDRLEWEIRVLFNLPLPWIRLPSGEANLYALNEYTYNLERGEGQRNEMAAGITLPLSQRLRLLLGWRHVDWVHSPDADQFEGSLQFQF